MIEKFSESTIKELGVYVYRLIDPRNGDTFYVGKGKGNRVFQHILTEKKLLDEVGRLDDNDDDISLKYNRIREINKTGLKVIHIIHRHNMSDEIALEVEAALIDDYPGITNLNSGKGNDFGPTNAFEIENRYKREEAVFGDDKVLMISINRTANEMDVYNAVRFSWKIDPKRAGKCDYVLAIEKGIIIGVFKAIDWKVANARNFPGFSPTTNKRVGFIGEEATEDVKKKYLYRRIPDCFRKRGAANPIKYNY